MPAQAARKAKNRAKLASKPLLASASSYLFRSKKRGFRPGIEQFAHGRWQAQRGALRSVGPLARQRLRRTHGHWRVGGGQQHRVQVQIAVREHVHEGREVLCLRCHRGGQLRQHLGQGGFAVTHRRAMQARPNARGRAALQPPGALRVAPQQQPPTLGTALQAA